MDIKILEQPNANLKSTLQPLVCIVIDQMVGMKHACEEVPDK